MAGICLRGEQFYRSGKYVITSTDVYQSPLSERYASREMQYIFSQDMKFRTWRRLWIALAETEKELGLSQNGKPVITQEQIDELKAHAEDINYDVARAREKEVRHDVMSHVYAYGQQCPKAAGIIHLGATSCYVGDNTDIIVMTEALKLVKKKLVNVMKELADFAEQYKAQPTLARGKEGHAVAAGVLSGSGGSGACALHHEAPGVQGNHGNPGFFPGAF